MWAYVIPCIAITALSVIYAIRTKRKANTRALRIKRKLQLARRDRNALREFEAWRKENPEKPLHDPKPQWLLSRCAGAYRELIDEFPEFREPAREKLFEEAIYI